MGQITDYVWTGKKAAQSWKGKKERKKKVPSSLPSFTLVHISRNCLEASPFPWDQQATCRLTGGLGMPYPDNFSEAYGSEVSKIS
jgi:hypothetical protein